MLFQQVCLRRHAEALVDETRRYRGMIVTAPTREWKSNSQRGLDKTLNSGGEV